MIAHRPLTRAVLAVALAAALPAWAADQAATLREVATANMRAAEAQDVEALMRTIDSRSPLASVTRENCAVLKGYALKYELVSFRFLGDDDEYAAARAVQRTVRTAGPEFRNNEIELILIFRKEGGAWKIWNQILLDTRYLPEPTPTPAP